MTDMIPVFIVSRRQQGRTKIIGVYRKLCEAQKVRDDTYDSHIEVMEMVG